MSGADHTLRVNFSYAVGQMLAVNAVPDTALLLDGPSCGFHKAELIHGNHDRTSTLLDAGGHHRVWNTDVDASSVIKDRRDVIAERLTALRTHPGTAMVLLSAQPMASVEGLPYQVVIDGLGDAGAPVQLLPQDPFDGDWLDGYDAVMETLAAHVPLPGGDPDPRRVALVGYGWDRGEGDHRADLDELRRLLRSLDLDPAPAWFSGEPLADGLGHLGGVGTVVSLPRGRSAARLLADRLGATLVETDLPLGLRATRRWLETIAAATDRGAQAEALVERELDDLVPRLEMLAARDLLHRRLAYLGEPAYAPGLAELGGDLGFELVAAILPARPHHRDRLVAPEALPVDTLWQPTTGEAQRTLAALHQQEALSLMVSNTHHLGIARALDLPFLEFGFPDRVSHRTALAPRLGFRGTLCFMEQFADRIRLFEAIRSEPVFIE